MKSQPLLVQHPTLLHVIVEAVLSIGANTENCYHIMKLLFEQQREYFDKMMSSQTHPTVIEMVIWNNRVKVSVYK